VVSCIINTFHTAFTVGYFSSFLLEVILTTIIRLGVFLIWEPTIFSLTPTVPIVVLPWTLREHHYHPKRITLFVADFFTSCVAAPVVEEFIKLKVLELCVKLPRNFL